MTGLPEDCFIGAGPMLGVREALDLLRARMTCVVGNEEVPLDGAAGRILAADVTSPRDIPGFDNAAVDGWAFAHGPWAAAGGSALRLSPGRAAAGHPLAGAVPPGHAVRVLTGAVMPLGTDTVALQEQVSSRDDRIELPPGLKPGANRRHAGEDVRLGQRALAAGRRLRPQDIGVAAAMGQATLRVYAPLTLALFSSGDELVEPGDTIGHGNVVDANRHLLRALLAALPVAVTDLGMLPDAAGPVRAALVEAAATHDLLLTSGGASRGDEDHVVRSVAELGRLDFWQIAMKPGRPLAFGRLGRSVFVGLPGNPVAAMVCFLRFARPVILALAGAAWQEPRALPVAAGFALRKKPGRTELVRARLEAGEGDAVVARRIEREGSGILTSLTEADGLVELAPELREIVPGDLVPFLGWAELGA